MLTVLGVSAFYHDSAAAIVRDGRIVAAAQEERFTRKKHEPGFPANAVRFCLSKAALKLRDVDFVVFYEKPLLKFERILETYLAFAPAGFASFRSAMPLWLRSKLFQRELLSRELHLIDPRWKHDSKLLFTEHHVSHAASAFYPSPFNEAAILTMDGVGEWATTSWGMGHGSQVVLHEELHFPHSLGLLYSAITHYLGFKVNSGEYKVMGLAPYGRPTYSRLMLANLIDVKPDGSFQLNQKYFGYCTSLSMINKHFERLLGGPARMPNESLSQRHMDVAASIQNVLEAVVLKMATQIREQTGLSNLCLAGGVALNCVANGKLVRAQIFDKIWIQPAAGDAGGAIGAALSAYYQLAEVERASGHDQMNGGYLGPSFEQDEIETRLIAIGAKFDVLADEQLIEESVTGLLNGEALGWFQGRMEFGPRALGARSILADPRFPWMQERLNVKVKRRESFRPFAPAVLSEDASNYFELEGDSPYMLIAAEVVRGRRVKPTTADEKLTGLQKIYAIRSDLPAVTHVDYSARVQTVHEATNARFHALIKAFKVRTGCPVVLNTSFNVRGEPIVCTPEEAFRCFMRTDIDSLAIGNCFLRKNDQELTLLMSHQDAFEPD